jgi:hypothetical protein
VVPRANARVAKRKQLPVVEASKEMSRTFDIVPSQDRIREEICQQTVSILENWLERARAGEIHEVVIVGITHDGTNDILVRASDTMSITQQVGCLEIAKMICLEDS